MEDGDLDNLFVREEGDEILSRNELQHAIHQNADLAIQISIVRLIRQEVAADIIQDSCEACSDIMLEIKLLYQQARIRKHRLESYQHPHNIRRGRARTSGGTQEKGELPWREWQKKVYQR